MIHHTKQALCQQRLLDWQTRFSKFGIRCVEVTGDCSGLRDVAASQLILTTPGALRPLDHLLLLMRLAQSPN